VWHAEQGRFVPLPSQHRPISWAWEHDGSICRDSFLSTEQILFTLHMLLERIMDIARTGSVHTAHAAGEDHGAGAAPALLRQCQPGSMVAESGSQKTRRQRARRQRAGKSGGSRGQETWRQQKPGSMVAAEARKRGGSRSQEAKWQQKPGSVVAAEARKHGGSRSQEAWWQQASRYPCPLS